MTLTKKQLEIINAPEDKIVVIASAGTSKTTVLTERIKRSLENGIKPQDIVCITFTNNAATEMQERIGKIGKGMFIGTVHSYSNYLLKCIGIDTSEYLENEDFDELFKLVKQNQECIQKVGELYLDEAQDSDANQFEFIFEMIKPQKFFVVGDFKQCIYSWKGSRPDLFLGLAVRYGGKRYELNENFRNCKSVLSFAKWIINEKTNSYSKNAAYEDDSIGLVQDYGIKKKIDYDKKEIVSLVTKNDKYNDWFILARTNDMVQEICNLLQFYDVPFDTFKQGNLSYEELKQKMADNTVKVLTIHAAKGLEANKVIVIGAYMRDEESCRVAYVAATRAKKELYWVNSTNKKKEIYKWT